MYLSSMEHERLQRILANVSDGCRCNSCQALFKEKNKLRNLLDDLKQTQAHLIQSEKMAVLGKLMAGLVHELNNPIGAMNSAIDVSDRFVNKLIEILSKNHSATDIRDVELLRFYAEALKNNNMVTIEANKRITETLNRLRSFVRLDDSQVQKVDLHEVLDNIVTLFKHEMNNRISVIENYGDISLITCNAAELNQVFMNILQNAVQSIPGRGEIIIRTFRENNNVCTQIRDTGIGIPPEQIKNLFEPTFSKKESRVKAGMGLFISLHIIEKHHGQIRVESEVGKGSTFTIILPEDRIEQNSDEMSLGVRHIE